MHWLLLWRNMEVHKGGEVRRVHVLYFLSRNGAIEHPHLIRVHHLHRHGVYLQGLCQKKKKKKQNSPLVLIAARFCIMFSCSNVWICVDVKRWLAELRGKDMPDSFAWSYKRFDKFFVFKVLKVVSQDLLTVKLLDAGDTNLAVCGKIWWTMNSSPRYLTTNMSSRALTFLLKPILL